ncbi:MAG: penicillin acylase family protein, partial [Alphaproteobacteria bacterium]
MHRSHRRIVVVFCLAAILTSCGGVLTWMAYQRSPEGPMIAGQAELPGLTAPVEVIRDRWGIPHIFAKTEVDLMRAMGYVQAQDRLFQMDILRRVTEGRLSEIVGEKAISSSTAYGGRTTVEQDIGMRILGFEHAAEIFMELVDDEHRQLFDAYAEGVNAFIAQNTDNLPIEFGLLGYEPELWRPVDSVVLSRMIGWGLATNAPLELVRAAADIVLGQGGGDRLLPLFDMKTPVILPKYKYGRRHPAVKFNAAPLAPLEKTDLSLETIYDLFSARDRSTPDASNNWVVAGSRSVSGKPILANDPHLGHLAPSVFHLIHLAGDGYDTIGASLPGVPFIILGHNRRLAWAVTNSQADVQDLYLHKVDPQNPERYLYHDTWEDFVVREEVVKIKEGSSHRLAKINVRISRFGPVITDLFNRSRARDVVSLRWTGMDVYAHPDAYWELHQADTAVELHMVAEKYRGDGRGNDMTALRKMNRGQSCDDFFSALSIYGNPRQNWICADDAGHIGSVTAGLVPVRNRGDGRRIARAWEDEGRWIAFIPFADLPQARDPERGYIVTANNQTFADPQYPYPWSFNFLPGDRASRIVEMLKMNDKVDMSHMSTIQ